MLRIRVVETRDELSIEVAQWHTVPIVLHIQPLTIDVWARLYERHVSFDPRVQLLRYDLGGMAYDWMRWYGISLRVGDHVYHLRPPHDVENLPLSVGGLFVMILSMLLRMYREESDRRRQRVQDYYDAILNPRAVRRLYALLQERGIDMQPRTYIVPPASVFFTRLLKNGLSWEDCRRVHMVEAEEMLAAMHMEDVYEASAGLAAAPDEQSAKGNSMTIDEFKQYLQQQQALRQQQAGNAS